MHDVLKFLKWLCGIRHEPAPAKTYQPAPPSFVNSLAMTAGASNDLGAQIELLCECQPLPAGCNQHSLAAPQMISVATKYSVAQCTRCAATEQWTNLLERGWISIVIRNRLFFFCHDCSPRCNVDPGENRRRYARCQRWAMRHHLAPRN